MRPLVICLALAPVLAFAQADLVGQDQFPQFRTFSGLPGSGFGIVPGGTPDFKGAMGISTPVAYSLGNLRFNLGVSNTSNSFGKIAMFGKDDGRANGTGWGLVGIGSKVGDFTLGYMVLSSIGDSVFTLHFSPKMFDANQDKYKTDLKRFDIGFGVQDPYNRGGDSGEKLDLLNKGGDSKSLYAVGTYRFSEDLYASVGTGTRRFKGVFGNVSKNFSKDLKGVLEYDTFNWNYAIAFQAAKFRVSETRQGNVTMTVGHIRMKYLTWSASVSF